jgi:hypothetical protein
MKFILALLLLTCLPASAAIIGTAQNNGGGTITLTDEESSCGGSTKKITTTLGGETKEGCWKKLDEQTDTIMVFWPEAGIYFYPLSGFKMLKQINFRRWL